jgi:hypothetical protein
MINLAEASRVRLRGGHLVHAIRHGSVPLMTMCWRMVKWTGPTGRTHDEALPAEQTVTCRACRLTESAR